MKADIGWDWSGKCHLFLIALERLNQDGRLGLPAYLVDDGLYVILEMQLFQSRQPLLCPLIRCLAQVLWVGDQKEFTHIYTEDVGLVGSESDLLE